MDGMDAGVMDTPDVESPEVEQPELEVEAPEVEGAQTAEVEQPESDKSNPYTTQFSRDYRKFLNEQKTNNPEAAKFLQQAKNDYGRLFALQQLEPKGIDGIREKYALLDSLQHGEAKGADALTALQETVREWDEFDQGVLSGDPKVFEGISPEFDKGLAKLAPAYLDRVAQSDPQAFQAAVLPHVVGMLQQTPVLEQFNYLVDVLNGKYGQLDEKTKLARTYDALAQMSEGFNALAQKATAVKASPQADPQKSQFETERTQFEQERQNHHWNSKIEPLVDKQRQTLFDTHFRPYQTRLKLNDKGTAGVANAFRQGIIEAARNDQAYQRQYRAFKSQKSPDPQAVSNYVNNWMAQRAKNVLDGIVNERYGNFLAGKPRPATPAARPAANRGPVEPNVEIRSVKPPMNEIDHRNTPLAWTASTYPGGPKYKLYNGKVVQIRKTV